METLLATQPSSYRELLKNSLILYRASFSKIIILSFFLSIVVFVPRLLSDVIGQEIFNVPPLNPHRLWILIVNLIGLIFFIGIIWRTHCTMRGYHEPLIEDLTVGIKKVMYVFFATLLLSAFMFAASLIIFGLIIILNQHHLLFPHHWLGLIVTVLIFFGQLFLLVYISNLFMFFMPIIATENKGVFGSIESSVLLVWNHWWRVITLQMTPWILYLFLLILIKYVFGINIHLYYMEQTPHTITSTVLHLIIFALFIPWVAATLLVQLRDLELRKAASKK